jgi:hypothetical protein
VLSQNNQTNQPTVSRQPTTNEQKMSQIELEQQQLQDLIDINDIITTDHNGGDVTECNVVISGTIESLLRNPKNKCVVHTDYNRLLHQDTDKYFIFVLGDDDVYTCRIFEEQSPDIEYEYKNHFVCNLHVMTEAQINAMNEYDLDYNTDLPEIQHSDDFDVYIRKDKLYKLESTATELLDEDVVILPPLAKAQAQPKVIELLDDDDDDEKKVEVEVEDYFDVPAKKSAAKHRSPVTTTKKVPLTPLYLSKIRVGHSVVYMRNLETGEFEGYTVLDMEEITDKDDQYEENSIIFTLKHKKTGCTVCKSWLVSVWGQAHRCPPEPTLFRLADKTKEEIDRDVAEHEINKAAKRVAKRVNHPTSSRKKKAASPSPSPTSAEQFDAMFGSDDEDDDDTVVEEEEEEVTVVPSLKRSKN